MGKAGRSAFTLIEILMVVAIIMILAAIATVNLLEAQVRAKVSRAQTDMRTVSVALEAYAVDHGRYPLAAGLDGRPIHPYPTGGPYLMGTRLSTCITTPIAYLTLRPNDPFPDSVDPVAATFYYITKDYSTAMRGIDGIIYFEDYVTAMNLGSRPGTSYVLASCGPDLIHNLLSRPST